MSLRQAQGSFGSKSGTRQQHGEQDTEHQAHDVTPSQLFVLTHKPARGCLRSHAAATRKTSILRTEACVFARGLPPRLEIRHRLLAASKTEREIYTTASSGQWRVETGRRAICLPF
jgi:hypothetical protein